MMVFRWFAVLALAGTIVLGSGSARAASLTYFDSDDVNETTTVQATGFPTGQPTIIPLPPGEDINVLINNAFQTAPLQGSVSVFTLTGFEPTGGPISDMVEFRTFAGSTTLEVVFISAAEGVTLVPVATPYGTAVELVGGNSIPLPTLPALNPALGGLSVTVISSPDAIPEPASMVMMGTGLAGVIGLGLRRRFKKV